MMYKKYKIYSVNQKKQKRSVKLSEWNFTSVQNYVIILNFAQTKSNSSITQRRNDKGDLP